MAASTSSLAIIAIIFSTTIIVQAELDSFTAELFSIDSPKSPFHDPGETHSERVLNSVRRSVVAAVKVNTDAGEPEIVNTQGEYLMKIKIGTPPVEILGSPDTSSDLIWTQCTPCRNCFKQEAPLFDPKKSTTYKQVACKTPQCNLLKEVGKCSANGRTCQFSYNYADGTYSDGDLATDNIILGYNLGKPVSIPNGIFGCAHNTGEGFNPQGTGLIGLGRGPTSLISQLSAKIGGKFSYCLVPISPKVHSSKMNFGSKAIVSGPGVQTTPIFSANQYILSLQAISVGNKRIPFPVSRHREGNIIINTGTTLSLLPKKFYLEFSAAVRASVPGKPVKDPNGILGLCYNVKANLKYPTITAHFKNANVVLPPANSFIQISDDIECLAFTSSADGAVFGNLQQVNFLIGFDNAAKTVSFKPTDCTRH